MNDKLILEANLLLLKSTVEVYVHGTLEASNDNIHDILKTGLDTIMKMQYDTYNKMTECGWYKISNVEAKEIRNTLAKLESKSN